MPIRRRPLFQAAGYSPPTSTVDRELDPVLQRLLERVGNVAAAAYSADWWILGGNEWWSALLGDPAAVCEHERNLVWQVFAGDDWRPLPKDRSVYEFKLALANDLRRQSIAFPHDAQLHRLITTLRDGNDEFAGMWQRTTAARHGAELG